MAKFVFASSFLLLVLIPFFPIITPEKNKVVHGRDELFLIMFIFIFFGFLLFQISRVCKIIYIYQNGIGFREYYSRKIRYIPFDYLDGYVESNTSDANGISYDVIYFIKKKRKVAWICESYYSNYYKLLENISLEHLGSEYPGVFKKILDQFEMFWYGRKYIRRVFKTRPIYEK